MLFHKATYNSAAALKCSWRKWCHCTGQDNTPKHVLKECMSQLAEGLTFVLQKISQHRMSPRDLDKCCSGIQKRWQAPCQKLLPCLPDICHLWTPGAHHLQPFEKSPRENNILTNVNHGFRSGFSCETQLVTMFHDFCRSYDNIQTDHNPRLFQGCWYCPSLLASIYINKLRKNGIDGNLHKWFNTFLIKCCMSHGWG